ncbi:MAG TPA: malonyl-ACP O-methyltransferase BioC [Denitromonas sp.]|uniref:malonyl-ACP O-methyltransferase BioC n=1 Tax=Denitromonas sp. TaxID=2734609 RepID=UPI001DC014A3|nr:malonyl-ACP O-methyltransferase BioC [Rhodocyclaceae bacterium]MCP5220586.1 malonyl-ACP O-methyltransferase BioC [Zoogloeaceae bacterium]HPR05035.1 malonyl-ACP O-methyltransferase BioC [Denitromonas sp.]HQU87108.1 malonyl-ACP O-methyltransferase BioC [Denitromonas sp.]HQV13892.1 malonyl-ACP O-methyltransferase BioC [Denitromonas sp.]
MTERKRYVRAAFDRAAPTYDAAAAVQREICAQLLALAKAHPPQGPVDYLLDAGCGTGTGALELMEWLKPVNTLALDFAPGMLARHPGDARQHRVCGDLESLPFANGSVDVVWSSLAVQWCNPGRAMAELGRVLKPGGLAWITTLGPDTLWELRDAFRGIDDAEHVIGFHSADTWQQSAIQAGFQIRSTHQSPTAATADSLRQLLKDIKAIGAHQVGSGRRRKPLGKSAWQQLERTYEQHRRADARLPATYDVIVLALQRIA